MGTLENRLAAIEHAMGKTANRLAGALELTPGQSPFEALAGAGVGLWFIYDSDGNTAHLGEALPDGTREVHSATK